MSLPESPQSSNEQINFDHIFGAENRRILDEEIRASQPIIIPPKIIEPVIVEVVEIQQPEEVVENPVELIQEPEVIKEPKELIELRRLWDAGELGMTEEMYNLHAQALMTWWVETGSSQQEN
jgi:hypothetical protein